MANVFVLLRDEKKSPELNKRRQIPLSSLHDLKTSGSTSNCEKSLMVSTFAAFNCHLNVIHRVPSLETDENVDIS